MYIYLTTNNINGKKYIGSKKAEISKSQTYYGSGTALKLAINKYGKDNFTKEVLFTCDNYEELKELELYILKLMNVVEDKTYYNLHDNFSGGYNATAYTEESRAKIGKANSLRVLSDYQRSAVWMNTPEVNAKKHPKATCVHCGKQANKANIERWHNDNCKNRVGINEPT